MKLHIFFTPAEVSAVRTAAEDVYIVIDVIRATTSITVISEQQAENIFIADTIERARAAQELAPSRLLCGERNVQPLPGFDYGNSPAQFAQTALSKKELILTTTNGTRAFFACPEQAVRLAGCFYNAEAVTTYALAQAKKQDSNLAIVCAGELDYFALDDSICAGYLAQELQRQEPDLVVHESVLAAISLYTTYGQRGLLQYSDSAQKVSAAGLQLDLEYCMRINASNKVPMVIETEERTGLLRLQNII